MKWVSSICHIPGWFNLSEDDLVLNRFLQDGQQGLLGRDEKRRRPEREGNAQQRLPSHNRRLVSKQSQEPQAEVGCEAFRDVQEHAEPHQGHRGRDEADPQPWETYDLPVHRWVETENHTQ